MFIALLSFNVGPEIIASVVRHKIKSIQIGEDQIKLSLCVDSMIMYTENSKESTKRAIKTNR